MAELVIETPEGITLRHELAGAGSRAAAGIVDLFVFVLFLLFALFLASLFSVVGAELLQSTVTAALVGGTLVFLVLYHAVFPLVLDGCTPGKRLFGLRVVDKRGWPASGTQYLLRAFFWPLEVALAVPVPLGILLMAVTEDRQRLGDLVAGTVCLRDTAQKGGASEVLGEPFQRETYAGLPSRTLGLAPALAERFDGADQRFLRELFARGGMDPAARRRLFVRAASHYEEQLGRAPRKGRTPEDAAELLRELYLYLRERPRA